MSSKHYFPETAVNTLVPRYLQALCTANPSLAFIPSQRVVLNTNHNPSNVSLISGGGSGHEPSWSGYVGDGILSAVACGDIFASPSALQILTAIASTPSTKGHILLITNYTGDCLHFGLAAERAIEKRLVNGEKCIVLPATDDVSIGRSKCEKVGRRGLAGNSITMKIVGAAAAKGESFERCVELGKAVNAQLVSVGSALDHCHVPGRQSHEGIGEDVVFIGSGIHNEPGAERISPFPPVENLMAQLLKLLCDQNDKERAFVKFNKGDDNVLLINNYGGLSNLELGALTQEALSQLDSKWDIRPTKIYSGTFETSLNGPGFSVSLCNISNAAEELRTSVDDLLNLLAAETKAPAWPNVLSNFSTKTEHKKVPQVNVDAETEVSAEEDIRVDPRLLDAMIRLACERAIKAEPDLTKWDLIMGDGDCGEGVKCVSEAILKILDNGGAKSGSVFTLLHAVIRAVDDMGGSLGAIFGILVAAFASALRYNHPDEKNRKIDIFAPSFAQAVTSLKRHTGARVGDRTVMDVLIPFSETLERDRNFEKAVKTAETAAEGTRDLKAKFGRASYIGEGGEEQSVPDPGAWALKEMVKGMYDASVADARL